MGTDDLDGVGEHANDCDVWDDGSTCTCRDEKTLADTPEKKSAWSDAERERRADVLPPGVGPVAELPEWAHYFQVGELIPLRGWNCRVVGHFNDDDGSPLGYALVPESMTSALKKKVLADASASAKRSKLRVVKKR